MGHEELVRSQINKGELVALSDNKVNLPQNLTIKTQNNLKNNSVLSTIIEMLLKTK